MYTPLHKRHHGLGRWIAASLLGATLLPATVQATEVTLKSWLKSQGGESRPYAVNQQITLYLELATNHWFTAGTRIGQFELPGVMVKQRNALATNFTQRRDGETWSHQRWELTLYPQQSGKFEIPAIAVQATVARPEGGSRQVTLTTRPQHFSAALPDPALTLGGRWLSASSLTLNQRWQRTANDHATSPGELRVGDAITRTVTASAEDTLSVLIPPLIPPLAADQGVQTYPGQARLNDTQERGEYRSTREDQSTYILQRGGLLTLPALELAWWNSQTGQLETLTLPGHTLLVRHTPASWLAAYWPWLVGVASGLTLLAWLLHISTRYYRHHPRPLVWQYGAAIWRRQWGLVRGLTYRYLRAKQGELELCRVSCDPVWQQQQAAFQQASLERASSLRLGWRLLVRLQTPQGTIRKRIATLLRLCGWRAALPGLAAPTGSSTNPE